MVERALWTAPVLDRLEPLPAGEDSTLLDQSGIAFADAAHVVGTGTRPASVPDLHAARLEEIQQLEGRSSSALRAHAVARAFSIAAATQLWLAGVNRGLHLPEPDFGSVADDAPLALLRASVRWRSVWLQHALRMGLGAALSVLGILIAGALLATNPPFWLMTIAVPIVAIASKATAPLGVFWGQITFTPLLLLNLAALNWPRDRDLYVVRIETVLIGAAVAAVLSFIVFPYGLRPNLTARAAEAGDRSLRYARAAIATARGASDAGIAAERTACLQAIVLLERTIDAANVHPVEAGGVLDHTEQVQTAARDRLVGGDVCAGLGRARQEDPGTAATAEASADWWTEVLGLDDPA